MPKKIILVVDDVADNIRILKNILEDEDYVIRAAKHGKRALELAKKEPLPNLVLLDVMMPEMDGYEVCRRLKENKVTQHIPVIFVTAKGDLEDEKTGFDVGGVDYITKPISPAIVIRRVATHLSLVRVSELDSLARDSIRMLGEAGHFNDTDTGLHIWRMASYSKAIAKAAGWSKEEYNMLELAAPMHDTGKIGIPDSILKAPRKLTAEEWEIMKSHASIGHDILQMSNNPVFQQAALVALGHHEKWDGSGYPQGLQEEEIPISARIVAIADVFDALTMQRPYKKAWSVEEAFEEMQRGSGQHFDPQLLKLFFSIKDEIIEIKNHYKDEAE